MKASSDGSFLRIKGVIFIMRDGKVVLGFLGNGKGANRYHIPYLQVRKDHFIVKTIWRRNAHHDSWPHWDGVIYTENIDDVLKDPEIDCVVIELPHSLHYSYLKTVLEAGKNVVCDKPFTETEEQAKEIFELAKEKGLMAQCYQNRRYDSDFLTTQKVMESGRLGDLLELEMSFDYYRPYVSENTHEFSVPNSFLYGHACHTLDQVISYFGKPDNVHFDVRQLLGSGRANDYFDIDLYYGVLKVSVKSSYFRVKPRPSFVVYGKKGMFVHEKKDLQERDLKHFYLPEGHEDFGKDQPEDYGTLTYYDDQNVYHEEKVPSVDGDYGRYYDALYETLVNGKEQLVKPEETLLQLHLLEEGIKGLH